jgi:hypothetical protein
MPFHRINLCLLLFACLFACLFANVLTAQYNDSNKVTIADIKTIHSAVLNEDRKIYVYQPDISSSQPLPVLYMLDGENISLVAGIVDYLSKNSELPL